MAENEHRKQIGPYRLTKHLSSRGSSDSYLGARIDDPQPLVIRVLRADTTASLVIRDRIIRKSEQAFSFTHPVLVPTLDVRREGREVVVTRGFEEGANLHRLLLAYRKAGRPFPVQAAFLILEQLLGGVASLQASSGALSEDSDASFHGGITLRNVFITSEGRVRLTGFGVGELGVREASVEAWKNRRMNSMSPRWIFAGTWGQEEDLFSIGALTYTLLTGEGVYGTMDTGSPEALRELVRVWEGVDINKLNESSSLKTANAVVRRLASPRPAGNFAGAQEAQDVLNSILPPLSGEKRGEVLRGLLDGSLQDGWVSDVEDTAPVPEKHPSAEGGATRTLLEASEKPAGGETLRGANLSSLGEEFQSVREQFKVIRGAEPLPVGGDSVPLARLSDSSGADERAEATLEVSASEIFGAHGGLNSEPTIDLIGVDERVQENVPTAQLPESVSVDQPIGQDDRTLDVDGSSLATPMRSETVVRLRTPHPKRIRGAGTRERERDVRKMATTDIKNHFEKAVLSEQLPPLRNSLYFRLLLGALSILFVLVLLLLGLWMRKVDRLQEVNGVSSMPTTTTSTQTVEPNCSDEGVRGTS